MQRREDHKNIVQPLSGVSIEEDVFSKRLQVQKKFAHKSLVAFFVFFSVFWNFVTWTVVLKAHDVPLWIFFSHVPVGVITAYLTLCYAFNSRKLIATRDRIQVSNGPLPWPGNKNVPFTNIRGFSTRKYIAYWQNKVPVHQYKVIAVHPNLHSTDIFRGLFTREEALKVEQLLEKHFRIQDDTQHDEEHRRAL